MFEAWKVWRRTGYLFDSRRIIFICGLFFAGNAFKQAMYIKDLNFEDYGEDHPHTYQEKIRRYQKEHGKNLRNYVLQSRQNEELKLKQEAGFKE